MSEIIFVAQDAPEGGYTARALEHPIFTEADTFEQLGRAVVEAVLCHFDNGTAPRFVRLHYVHEDVIPIHEDAVAA